jgi:predicted NBD/HSP70 family sugar kinase
VKLVFDIGGTHFRLALTDGRRLERVQVFETDPTTAGFEALIATVRHYLRGESITEAVGGLPGQLSRSSGRLVHTPNLPGWKDLPVARRLEAALGCPVTVQNDAALVGLGEAAHGAGRGVDIVVFVTVSTGVNGVRIVNGAIDHNAHGFEIGAQLLAGPNGESTLEDLVGGAALAKRSGQAPASIDSDNVWYQEAFYLARGLYNSLIHWSPELIVLGGPMMKDIHLSTVKDELHQLPKVLDTWPAMRLATLGDEGGLYGAMAYISAKS